MLSFFVSIPLSLFLSLSLGSKARHHLASHFPVPMGLAHLLTDDQRMFWCFSMGSFVQTPRGEICKHPTETGISPNTHTHCSKDVAETWQNWFTEMDPLNWSFSVAISRSSTLVFTVYRGLKYFDPCPGDRNMLMLTNKKPRLI